MFVTPLAYLVSALFLLDQGWNFSLLLRFLNDPLAAAGPVMQFYFGGSFFIFWLPVMFICAVLSMRLVAEERARGTLEALLTAPLRPSQVIIGKYLGVLTYYVLLWVPTGCFYILLRSATRWSPDSAPEVGPIISGYLGAGLVGACFLALGLLASALVRSQLAAAIVSFVSSSIFLLSGLLVDRVGDGFWSGALAWTNLLAMMQEMSRGIVDGHWLWLHAGVVGACLVLAMWAIDSRRDLQTGVQVAAFVVFALCLSVLGGRNATRDDWTDGHVFSLSERAQQILRTLPRDVDVTVLVPETIGGGRVNPVRVELREVLLRMAKLAPRLRVRMIDPDRQREDAERLVASFGLGGRELVDGVILIRSGEGPRLRRHHLLPEELVTFETGPEVRVNGPRVKSFRGESELLNAFLDVSAERRRRVCHTQGHGEPAFDGLEPYHGYAKLRDLLRSARVETQPLQFDEPVTSEADDRARPAGGIEDCDVLLIAGVRQTFPPSQVEQVHRFLERGGKLLMLAGANIARDHRSLVPHGLERELARFGVVFGQRVVLDPHPMPADTPLLAFSWREGWHEHPMARGLTGKLMSFQHVRELQVRAPAEPVFSVGEAAWAESDLRSLINEPGHSGPSFEVAGDRRGPIPLVVASELGAARVVVIASDKFALNARLREDVVYDHGRELLLGAVAWLTEREGTIGLPERRRQHVKLLLAPEQLDRMVWMSTLGLPAFSVLLGIFMLWRRRGV